MGLEFFGGVGEGDLGLLVSRTAMSLKPVTPFQPRGHQQTMPLNTPEVAESTPQASTPRPKGPPERPDRTNTGLTTQDPPQQQKTARG